MHRWCVTAAGWIDLLDDTDIALIGGLTDASAPVLHDLLTWACFPQPRLPRRARNVVAAEADGKIAALLSAAGFAAIDTAVTYHLPIRDARGAAERPIVLGRGFDHDAVWDRFYAAMQFKPGMTSIPAIAEPESSALYEAVRVLKPMNYFLVTDQDADKVLEIFVRVNSGGTTLSYSDLLLSMATNQWKELDAREEVRALAPNSTATRGGSSPSPRTSCSRPR